jgi:hypothetical protein
MITEFEHKKIYKIVDEFGGERKENLRAQIIFLLARRERNIKNKIANVILDL